MTVRVWRGWAAADHAEEIAAHLRDVPLAHYASMQGSVAAYVMQRPLAGGVELTTVTVWESSEAVPAGVEENHRLLVARQRKATCSTIVAATESVARAA
jgi:heme-degrading monooxygenase HmoA